MLNPVTAIIQMYRSTLLYHGLPPSSETAVAIAFGLAMMLLGSSVFDILERRFAEEI
jgi:ABC-type polysaccharide/polyol phosphate export permease